MGVGVDQKLKLSISQQEIENSTLVIFLNMTESTLLLPIGLANGELFDDRGFVAGQWKHAADKKVFPVIEPSSGKVLANCSDFTRQDFTEAIECADYGYKRYFHGTTAKQRSSYLHNWNKLILENIDDCM